MLPLNSETKTSSHLEERSLLKFAIAWSKFGSPTFQRFSGRTHRADESEQFNAEIRKGATQESWVLKG